MLLAARREKMDNSKLDKYDDAFLFSLGLVGLIISFIEIGKNSITETASAIPFLLLGILLPFIVGYLRGAIQQNSIEERMRGWIYFFIGTTSYFAFFVIIRMGSYNYWVREGVFIFIIAIGVVTAYAFINWSKKLFDVVHNPLDSYAYSATALGVFGFSILFSLLVGMFYDFQVNDIWQKIRASFTEQLFWFSIVLFIISMVLIFEKGSRCAIQNELRLQNEHEVLAKSPPQLQGIWKLFRIKSLFLGFVLFEYSFDFNLEARNLQARTLWILSFVSWSFGCLLKTEYSFFASLFFVITIISSTIAALLFYKSQIYDFRDIDKAQPTKISYVFLVFSTMSLIVLGGNKLQLIMALILLILLGVIILFGEQFMPKREHAQLSTDRT